MSSHDPIFRSKEESSRARTRAETPPPSFWRRWFGAGAVPASAPIAEPEPETVVANADPIAPAATDFVDDSLATELAALDPLADSMPEQEQPVLAAPPPEALTPVDDASTEPPPATAFDDLLAHELAAFDLPTVAPAPAAGESRIVIERVYAEDIVLDPEVTAPVVLDGDGIVFATQPALPESAPEPAAQPEPVSFSEASPEPQPEPVAEPAPEAPREVPASLAEADEYEDGEEKIDSRHTDETDTRPRVLIVEDDRGQALFAQSVLHGAGLRAEVETAADNVLDAIARFDPDLVLMDLHLPGSNGLHLTQAIRARPDYLHLPVVFLSGDADPEREYEVLHAGADDFLTKPIRPRHLIAAVSNRIQRARLIRSRQRAPEPTTPATGDTPHTPPPPAAPAVAPPLSAQLIDATLGDATVELAFQPIVAAAGSGTAQFQVLLRLRRADGALVTAAQAVPAAELAGRIVELDRQVIEHSLALLARREAEGAPLRLFVSQSPRTLAPADAAARLMRAIDARGADPAALVIELRLADALAHTAMLRRFCQPLTIAGVQFSLSQYEAGAEAEAMLGRLPLSYLRLSQRYAGVHTDPALGEELRAIVDLARRHGLRSIAQQVEDARAAVALRDLGVDFLQGNLMQEVGRGLGFDFHKPVH